MTLTQAPSLQNYPVLVHYFKKSNATPAPARAKRARHAKQESDAEADTEGSSSVVDDMQPSAGASLSSEGFFDGYEQA